MKFRNIYTSNSEKETKDIAKKIFKEKSNDYKLIILIGNLASGKTTIVKAIANKLDIKDNIVSPTFGYKRTYKRMNHYDLYLLKKINKKELLSQISEDMENGLVIIEWGNKIPKIKNSIVIKIEEISEEKRKIIVTYY